MAQPRWVRRGGVGVERDYDGPFGRAERLAFREGEDAVRTRLMRISGRAKHVSAVDWAETAGSFPQGTFSKHPPWHTHGACRTPADAGVGVLFVNTAWHAAVGPDCRQAITLAVTWDTQTAQEVQRGNTGQPYTQALFGPGIPAVFSAEPTSQLTAQAAERIALFSGNAASARQSSGAVSYTHLTLPTKA